VGWDPLIDLVGEDVGKSRLLNRLELDHRAWVVVA
jgi:hypothetical protein